MITAPATAKHRTEHNRKELLPLETMTKFHRRREEKNSSEKSDKVLLETGWKNFVQKNYSDNYFGSNDDYELQFTSSEEMWVISGE